MHPWINYRMAQDRMEELLREGEHMRMVRAATLEHHDGRRFYRRWANWLGTHMVRWGQKLEDFGALGEACSAQSQSSLY
jgi:flavodoxin